ncbi:MAG: putative DNA binding domain-containing protein [Candidatus Aminicenantes bacterium]|nr:putative DNA binding domain-containing protein [Candidatus Aminicenantes bacterium]
MLTEEELLKSIHDLESDNIERTVATKDTDKFGEAICAFANDFPGSCKPGYLVVGVKDNGELSGLTVTDELLRNLGGIRSDGNIQPLPALIVKKFSLPGGDVAVVEVLPSDLPPARYKGRVWIRVGPRRAIASESEERVLSERRTSLIKTFDVKPCTGCSLDDLAIDCFSLTYRSNAVDEVIIKENNRDIRHQLASLRFFDLNKNCATFAGVLLFGKDPLYWLPGAYIQFVRFAGEKITDEPIQELMFSGDLLSVLRELDSFLSLQIKSRPVKTSVLREKEKADYPLIALREFLMNAVMHRTYESNTPIRFYWFDNRVEIQSPGGLYGEAKPENFPMQNSYRNPVVAEAMKVLGYVNKFGRGVLRAQEALFQNGNPLPEYNFQPNYFLTTIRSKT